MLLCNISLLSLTGPPDDPTSHASSFLPEKNSTFSNSSASSFESNPITTIIIPNKGSSLIANSNSDNVNNVTGQSAHKQIHHHLLIQVKVSEKSK